MPDSDRSARASVAVLPSLRRRSTELEARIRDTAGIVALLAERVAETLEELADTRDELALIAPQLDVEIFRRDAQRAREVAQSERRACQRLRDKWGLAGGD
jgi:hypothetical protein